MGAFHRSIGGNFCTADLAAMQRSVSPLDRLQAQNGAGPVRTAAAEKRTRFR